MKKIIATKMRTDLFPCAFFVSGAGDLVNFDPDIHRRRSIRLADHDYSSAGFYFVTICVQGREFLLGEITDDEVVLSDAGRMVENTWKELLQRFPNVQLDIFVVMPNHVHGILILVDQNNINNGRGEPCVRPDNPVIQCRGESCIRPELTTTGVHKDRPYGTLDGSAGRVLQVFKSITIHAYIQGVNNHNWSPFPGKLWQRNYYERVIRNDNELNNIRQYIHDNPAKCADDNENPANHPTAIDQ